MTMNDDQKRLIAAVIFSSIILIGWQYLFPPNPIVVNNSPIEQVQQSSTSRPQAPALNLGEGVNKMEDRVYDFPVSTNEKILFNQNFEILDYNTKKATKKFVDFAGLNPYIGIQLVTSRGVIRPQFYFEEKQANSWVGEDKVNNIILNLWATEDGFLKFKFTSTNPYKYQFVIKTSKMEKSSRQKREFLFYNEKKVIRHAVGDSMSEEGHLKWFGIDFDYNLFSYVLDNPTYFNIKAMEDGNFIATMTGALEEVSGEIIYTLKNYDQLKTLGSNLNLSVDFGFFGIIAVPILKGLQFFYHFIPNYGISILILTLILRLVTFPLQLNSMKSMKKMQKIQPELSALKERYKGDPQKLNLETMALFKRAKVNPLGGCLPMLLQMPIFIAFYQVLNCAVELVNAPFFAHIHDLSIKDPYYIFPVLMTAVMFLQQKMTPSSASMDATQQKMMQFMPLVFGFVMIEMPAGLTLYMFFSTFLGIGQQFLVNKYA